MNIKLVGRNIPRNTGGDPDFPTLTAVRSVFTDEEIVCLVNRCLYQLEYQQRAHLKRARMKAEQLKPIRDYLRKVYDVTYDKATEQQIKEAVRSVEERNS